MNFSSVKSNSVIKFGMWTYGQDKLNIQANAPSPLLTQSSVQKKGGITMGLTVLRTCIHNHWHQCHNLNEFSSAWATIEVYNPRQVKVVQTCNSIFFAVIYIYIYIYIYICVYVCTKCDQPATKWQMTIIIKITILFHNTDLLNYTLSFLPLFLISVFLL